MTRIVTTHYRYKRPPKKRKAVALEVPTIVTRARVAKAGKFPTLGNSAPAAVPPPSNDDRKSTIVTPKRKAKPGNDNQPVIVTAKPKRRTDGMAMELPASRREPAPVERDGDDYKRLKAAMARRLRGG